MKINLKIGVEVDMYAIVANYTLYHTIGFLIFNQMHIFKKVNILFLGLSEVCDYCNLLTITQIAAL